MAAQPGQTAGHTISTRLKRLIRPNTRAIYINTPHNPTGLLMQPRTYFRHVLETGRCSHGIYVFCDEVYRELEHDPNAPSRRLRFL